MFFIANIHCVNNQTYEEEVIRVTTERHYTLPNNGPAYAPHLKSVLNFEEQLFARGATTGEASVGVGELVIENNDAEFDAYRKYSFDGRLVEIFMLQDLNDAPTEANVFFRGTAFYAEPQFTQISIYLKNRLEILTPLIQPATFLGTNNGGDVGYEGNEGDIKGKTKPMVWGTCLNVPPAPINKSRQMFGVNHDIDGNRKAVAKFFNVADKGGSLMFAGDLATIELLRVATVASGFYKTCVAEGAFKVGRVPQGDITCDVAEVLGEDSSAPRTVQRILEECYGLISGVDFDAGSLEALHLLNKTACGYYVDEEVEGLTVINALLSSIGGWFVPDRLGVFRAGRFDLPTAADEPVATYDDSLIVEGSLVRLATGDQGHGIPAKSYTLYHTKLWKVLSKSETLVSVNDSLREYYAQEFRGSTAEDLSVAELHPLAPDLSEESLMTLLPPVKLQPFLDEDMAAAPSNWDQPGDASVLGDNMVDVAYGLTYNFGSIAVGGATVFGNQIEELWNGKFVLKFFVAAHSDAEVSLLQGTTVSATSVFTVEPDPVVGWNEYEFEYLLDSPTRGWLLTASDASGTASIGKFSITPKPLGLTPDQEAQRRLGIYSADLERYSFDVPILEGLYTGLGQIIVMKTFGRMELTEGRKYVVIGKNIVADEDKVSFDVIGEDNAA